jgi:hypothetical protein
MIELLLLIPALLEGVEQAIELDDRRRIFRQAREYADSVGKSLLVVGTPKLRWTHPCGDVTIDIDPGLTQWCNTEIADIRAIPYADQYFGAAFCSHVLEHMTTVADCCKALDELHRVAEKVFVCLPQKNSILAWINAKHHLWVKQSDDGYVIDQRGPHRELLTNYHWRA